MAKNDLDAHSFILAHAQTDRWMRTQFAQALDQTELTMMEWLLLTSTNKHADTGMTVTEAAEELAVSLPQITALTQQLLKKDLITQQIEKHDRRSRRLHITEAGKAICDKGCKAVEDTLDELSEAPQMHTYKNLIAKVTS